MFVQAVSHRERFPRWRAGEPKSYCHNQAGCSLGARWDGGRSMVARIISVTSRMLCYESSLIEMSFLAQSLRLRVQRLGDRHAGCRFFCGRCLHLAGTLHRARDARFLGLRFDTSVECRSIEGLCPNSQRD